MPPPFRRQSGKALGTDTTPVEKAWLLYAWESSFFYLYPVSGFVIEEKKDFTRCNCKERMANLVHTLPSRNVFS